MSRSSSSDCSLRSARGAAALSGYIRCGLSLDESTVHRDLAAFGVGSPALGSPSLQQRRPPTSTTSSRPQSAQTQSRLPLSRTLAGSISRHRPLSASSTASSTTGTASITTSTAAGPSWLTRVAARRTDRSFKGTAVTPADAYPRLLVHKSAAEVGPNYSPCLATEQQHSNMWFATNRRPASALRRGKPLWTPVPGPAGTAIYHGIPLAEQAPMQRALLSHERSVGLPGHSRHLRSASALALRPGTTSLSPSRHAPAARPRSSRCSVSSSEGSGSVSVTRAAEQRDVRALTAWSPVTFVSDEIVRVLAQPSTAPRKGSQPAPSVTRSRFADARTKAEGTDEAAAATPQPARAVALPDSSSSDSDASDGLDSPTAAAPPGPLTGGAGRGKGTSLRGGGRGPNPPRSVLHGPLRLAVYHTSHYCHGAAVAWDMCMEAPLVPTAAIMRERRRFEKHL